MTFNVGILIWENAEVLDFCGPFEVFRNASRMIEGIDMDVFIVSKETEPVNAQGMTIVPQYNFENCPGLNILIIPGGNSGWVIKQNEYLDWVMQQSSKLNLMLTVCTGALVPAQLGLITDGMDATTHQEGIPYLKKMAPTANVMPYVRFTDNERIVMSGGISAGIDGSLYTVKKLWDEDSAKSIARYMEYDWRITEPNTDDPSLR